MPRRSDIARKSIIAVLAAFLTCAALGISHADKRILVLGWNVESGDNDPVTIAKSLAELEGYDLIGLCEVKKGNASLYARAAAVGEGAKGSNRPNFKHEVSKSGDDDRLVIIWDAKRLTLIGEPQELDNLNDGNHRSPFFAHFKLKDTDTEFLFMVNHLARGDESLRQRQATGLGQWAAQQTLPIIAVGDYNFDYDIDDGIGNQAMKNMLSQDVFEWVQPPELFKTHASLKYNGVLDFVFISHKPNTWKVDSKILTGGFPFPDNSETSDHRPVQGRILISSE